jgi:hypothetical protein
VEVRNQQEYVCHKVDKVRRFLFTAHESILMIPIFLSANRRIDPPQTAPKAEA